MEGSKSFWSEGKLTIEHPDMNEQAECRSHINSVLSSVRAPSARVCLDSICLSAQGRAIKYLLPPSSSRTAQCQLPVTITRRTWVPGATSSSQLPEHFPRGPVIQPLSRFLSRAALQTVNSWPPYLQSAAVSLCPGR